MPVVSESGQPSLVSYELSPHTAGPRGPRARSLPSVSPSPVWRQWRSLRGDMLRRLHECDRRGVTVTLDQLADDLDEALGLIERRAAELQAPQLVHCHSDRRIEVVTGAARKCG